jgi:hypothetical protein
LENKRSTFMYRNGMIYRHFRAGIPNLFWMATHLTKLPRFRDTPLTVRPPPPLN